MKLVLQSLLSALSIVLLVSCEPDEANPAPQSGTIHVVATTTMVADMLREIGGADISVTALMGAGVDPHLYKATAEDAQALGTASAIFYNGLMLEGRMSELLDQLAKRGKPVHAVTSKMPHADLLQSDDGTAHPDPHVWGDAKLWSSSIEIVVEGLSKVLPDKAAAFAEGGAKLKADYLALHEWVLAQVATIPAESRILITSHDAFNYFGRAYGFKVVGVQGISTVSEAGLADVAKTVDFIKTNKVKAIFVESSVPHATIERIAKDSGAKIGGELFSDALGDADTDSGTYPGMLRSNVNSIVSPLN